MICLETPKSSSARSHAGEVQKLRGPLVEDRKPIHEEARQLSYSSQGQRNGSLMRYLDVSRPVHTYRENNWNTTADGLGAIKMGLLT